MTVRALVVGLEQPEADSLRHVMDRMGIPSQSCAAPAQALAAAQRGDYHLAIIGYEGEGCGLPLAVGMTMLNTKELVLDCIVVADRMCPALEKAARDLGLLGVLVRPVRAGALASVVESHIAKRFNALGVGTKSKAVA